MTGVGSFILREQRVKVRACARTWLARELGDCSDNKWKLAKLVFACLENFLFNKEALRV